MSDNSPSISDPTAPLVQQLSGVHGSFSSVRRHQQVKVISTRRLCGGSIARVNNLSLPPKPQPQPGKDDIVSITLQPLNDLHLDPLLPLES